MADGKDRRLVDIQAHVERVVDMLIGLEQAEPTEDAPAPPAPPELSPPPELKVPAPTDALTTLIRAFELSTLEADLFRIALAAELDVEVADTYARLQGDRRCRRPQVAFALRLIELDPLRRIELVPLLHEGGALRRHRLLELVPPVRGSIPLFMELELTVPPDLLHHLGGMRTVSSPLAHVLQLVKARATLAELPLPSQAMGPLETLAGLGVWKSGNQRGVLGPSSTSRFLVYLQGKYGSGREQAAEALAQAWGLDLLRVHARALFDDLAESDILVGIILRDARRLQAVPCFVGVEGLIPEASGEDRRPGSPVRLERLLASVADFPGPVIFTSEIPPTLNRVWCQRHLVPVSFESTETDEHRVTLWWKAVSRAAADLDQEVVKRISRSYPFTPGQMLDAVEAARALAAVRNPVSPVVRAEDLEAGCVSQLRHSLESLSRKTRSRFTWDDLVLPALHKKQLRMFENFIRNRELVYITWNLGRRLSYGRGIKALFHGASGTGKTMAAQVVANGLHIDLFKVDLSSLVSKWVGETEKNLERIFNEAQKSHAIILFDEADALFGKRGTVEKGTDRYSNMEVNYLLQRFEEYDGTVILTSNFPRGIDDAFSRRMHFVIEFPTPDSDMRLHLWKAMIPPELPMAEDVDLNYLSNRFELTGGYIQNIILTASFMAAEEAGQVTMLHIMRAIQWEYQKIGRSTSRGEFEHWFDQLE